MKAPAIIVNWDRRLSSIDAVPLGAGALPD
jgi:hypothetical protein